MSCWMGVIKTLRACNEVAKSPQQLHKQNKPQNSALRKTSGCHVPQGEILFKMGYKERDRERGKGEEGGGGGGVHGRTGFSKTPCMLHRRRGRGGGGGGGLQCMEDQVVAKRLVCCTGECGASGKCHFAHGRKCSPSWATNSMMREEEM